jgi:hypothetical protein
LLWYLKTVGEEEFLEIAGEAGLQDPQVILCKDGCQLILIGRAP